MLTEHVFNRAQEKLRKEREIVRDKIEQKERTKQYLKEKESKKNLNNLSLPANQKPTVSFKFKSPKVPSGKVSAKRS